MYYNIIGGHEALEGGRGLEEVPAGLARQDAAELLGHFCLVAFMCVLMFYV